VCSTQLTPVTSTRDITRVETRLCDSLAFEDYDFSPLLNKDALLRTYRISQEAEIPTKIVVDNTSHPSFTLIDLQTPDRLGLLYDLLRALGEEDVNIELSRITTEMDVAMDTFYITDGNGKIIDESAIKRIQRLLQRASVRSVG
jgi:[protein-PII] uridylyltransferase